MRLFEIAKGWEDKGINLPKRGTANSYGYDLEAAEDITVPSRLSLYTDYIWAKVGEMLGFNDLGVKEEAKKMLNKTILVPTGLKAKMGHDEVLKVYPRSSTAVKKGLSMPNSVGIIDSDYYSNPDNDGHIMVPFVNNSFFHYTIKKGERIAQAGFEKFLVTDNDNSTGSRDGGFGSTGDK